MFGFTKNVFVVSMTFLGCNVLNVNPLKCVSMNNQECKVRPEVININSNNFITFILSFQYSCKYM